ncbi:MAG: CRTAC1 family protein [Gemmatimonadaceae bacterium]|nr:CRTAC1 family protein [Gemmatimonadaceae bacterium]
MSARFALLAPLLLLLPSRTGMAPPRFTPLQPELLGTGTSFTNAAADYDGDGDLDLYVGFGGAPNRLYRNDAGTLVEVGARAGLAIARGTRAAAWADYDGDGDPDLLVGYAPGPASVVALYRNDAGTFADVTAAAGVGLATGGVRQPSFIDFDGDGDLDLSIAFRDRANALFRNERGTFHEMADSVGLADPRKSVGALWLDADEDGDLDFLVANQDGDANALFRNDGARFTDVGEAMGVAWGGRAPKLATNGSVRPCAADVDGDGHFDLAFANYGPNGLLLRRGPVFTDVSAAWGVGRDGRYDTCAFADYDHDGRLDLYVNGTVTGGTSYPDVLHHHTGTAYADETPENISALQADHGALWFDIDRDGDLDLALTGAQAAGMHLVLRNDLDAAAARRSLQVRVLDGAGRATRAGAEVRVYAAGTRRLLGAGLVDTGSGYNAQSDMSVHIGLARLQRVDVEVTWPSRGTRRVVHARGIAPGRHAGGALVVRVP